MRLILVFNTQYQTHISLFINMKIFYLIFCLFFRTNANRKPLLVVSFDGLRADKFDEFITKNPKSAFSVFIKNGVKAEYMEPVFPSSTYPNHMTMVTG